MNKEIKGKRIILREQREEDAPFFAYWFNQPKVMFQCGFEKPTDEDEVKTCINVSHKSDDSVWFTITDLDGNIIGETGPVSYTHLDVYKRQPTSSPSLYFPKLVT